MKYLHIIKFGAITIGSIVFLLIALMLLGSFLPIGGGYQVRIVESGSMEPTIPTGAAILTKLAPDYVVGDVVTFKRQGDVAPTTHRILAVDEGMYTMQGDANNTPDLIPVAKNEILGVVFFQVPFLGFVLDFVRQPLGFLVLVGLPALWIVYEQAVRIVGVVRSQKIAATTETEQKNIL